MLNKLLVGIDESASSEWAFETALELAKALRAELVLVHVLDILALDNHRNPIKLVDNYLDALDEQTQADYELKMTEFAGRYNALLQERQAAAKAADVTVHCLQPHGSPGPVICQAASDNHVDLIVVGNRDRSTLNELAPGSVSNYVVHHAPCSVTVVHTNDTNIHNTAERQSALSSAECV